MWIKNLCSIIEIGKDGRPTRFLCGFMVRDPETSREHKLEFDEDSLWQMKWLQKIPGVSRKNRAEMKKEVEDELRKQYSQGLKNQEFRFVDIGWYHIEHMRGFAFSDCFITAHGVDIQSRACCSRFAIDAPKYGQITQEELRDAYLRLLHIVTVRKDILYPLLLSNVAAVMNEILGQEDMAPALVFWLQGKPGTGKTELAMALGSFVHPKENTSKRKNLFAANGIPRNMVKSLVQHQGLNFILDDVKKEKVCGQRDKTWKCVDTCIRSVFAQRIVDSFSTQAECNQDLAAGAIITGEALEIGDSSKARIVYLPIGDFINDEEGAEILAFLQKNPEVLTLFMVGVLQFVCGCMEKAENCVQIWANDIRDIWREERGRFCGSNKSRLARTLAMLQFCSGLLKEYGRWLGIDFTGKDESFWGEAELSLRLTMKRTEALLENAISLLYESLAEVLDTLRITTPEYIDVGFGEETVDWAASGFLMDTEADGIYIKNVEQIADVRQGEVLLVKKEVLLALLNSQIHAISKKLSAEDWIQHKVSLTTLREAGIILAQERSDRTCNNQIAYPSRDKIFGITEIHCVVLNLKNPQIIKWKQELDRQYNEDPTFIEDITGSKCNEIWAYQRDGKGILRKILTRIMREFRMCK